MQNWDWTPTSSSDPPPLCQSCGKRPSAFLVKHRETTFHWRCVTCMRRLVDGDPIVVAGQRTRTRAAWHHRSLTKMAAAARLAAESEDSK